MASLANEWKNDEDLKFQLESLVKKAYQKSEIVLAMRKKFPQYSWGCIKTFDHRLCYFNINYINYDTRKTSWGKSNDKETSNGSQY